MQSFENTFHEYTIKGVYNGVNHPNPTDMVLAQCIKESISDKALIETLRRVLRGERINAAEKAAVSQAEIESKQVEIESKRVEIESKEKQIVVLTTECNAKDREIADLKAQIKAGSDSDSNTKLPTAWQKYLEIVEMELQKIVPSPSHDACLKLAAKMWKYSHWNNSRKDYRGIAFGCEHDDLFYVKCFRHFPYVSYGKIYQFVLDLENKHYDNFFEQQGKLNPPTSSEELVEIYKKQALDQSNKLFAANQTISDLNATLSVLRTEVKLNQDMLIETLRLSVELKNLHCEEIQSLKEEADELLSYKEKIQSIQNML